MNFKPALLCPDMSPEEPRREAAAAVAALREYNRPHKKLLRRLFGLLVALEILGKLLAKTVLIVGLAVCIFLFGPTRTYIVILGVFVVLWAKEASKPKSCD